MEERLRGIDGERERRRERERIVGDARRNTGTERDAERERLCRVAAIDFGAFSG